MHVRGHPACFDERQLGDSLLHLPPVLMTTTTNRHLVYYQLVLQFLQCHTHCLDVRVASKFIGDD